MLLLKNSLAVLFFLASFACTTTPEKPVETSESPTQSFAPDLIHFPVKATEFIFDKVPFAEAHASTLIETKTGLLVAWMGGTREGASDVSIWVSRLVDKHWSTPMSVVDGVEIGDLTQPVWNPVLFQPAGGPIYLFYKIGRDPTSWSGRFITSQNEGKTWSYPRKMPDGTLGATKNKPIQLSNGKILAPSSTEGRDWRVHVETSSDGHYWRREEDLLPKNLHVIQPTLIAYSDQKIQLLARSGTDARTSHHKIMEAWSTDEGKTWSELKDTELFNPNSGIDATLLKDGRAFLVYPSLESGLTQLNAAISKDQGKTWKVIAYLEKENEQEFSYPAVIQTRDGLVHMTYTWNRRKIKHVALDPKLYF